MKAYLTVLFVLFGGLVAINEVVKAVLSSPKVVAMCVEVVGPASQVLAAACK